MHRIACPVATLETDFSSYAILSVIRKIISNNKIRELCITASTIIKAKWIVLDLPAMLVA